MSKKKKTSMIGHDPLAWIQKDTASSSAQGQQASEQEEKPTIEVQQAEQSVATSPPSSDAQDSTTVGAVLDDVVQALEPSSVLCLQGDLTIQTIHELHSQCQAVFAGEGDITLDAAAVGRVDTAAVQLLWALVQKLKAEHRAFSWQEPAVGLLEVASTLGLAESLELPQ